MGDYTQGTPVFAPDGSVRSIPDAQLQDAIKAGGKLAVQMNAPDGSLRYVPHDQVGAAQAAGGRVNLTQGTTDAPKPAEGFWHSLGAVFGITPEAKQAAEQKAANMTPMQEAFAATKPPNPVDVVKNAASAVGSEFKKGSQEGQQSLDSLKHGDIKGFLAHQIGQVGHAGAAVLAPVFGENLSKSGEQIGQGDIAGGLGTATGVLAPVVTGAAIPGKTPTGNVGLAEKMYQSALKPPLRMGPEGVANVVRTGLEQGIPVSEAGAVKLDGLIKDLQGKIKQQIGQGAAAGKTVDPGAVASRLDQARARFQNQVTPGSDLAAIDATKQEFLDSNKNPIPVDQAQAMKQGTYQQLKGKAYGELKSATIESQKALARGLKEELEAQFPEIKGLNAQEGQFFNLQGTIEKALARIGNHQLIGIGTPIMAAAGGAAGGAEAATSAGLLKMILDNPTVKSRLAIALNKAGRGAIPLTSANARVLAYSNALAQSASAGASESSPSQ